MAILAESDAERVPELVPERYARMMQNPFAFLRGAAAVMAADLAHQPVPGIKVQAGGDSHLMNFGAFITPEDNILFDINDFDETIAGVDFTVDLKRLAASVAVAVLANGESKTALAQAAAKPVGLSRTYVQILWIFLRWRSGTAGSISNKSSSISRVPEPAAQSFDSDPPRSAPGLDKDDNFPHLVTAGEPRIADKPPTIFHIDHRRSEAARSTLPPQFALYRDTLTPDRTVPPRPLSRSKDVAFKAVGVGSVGTICCRRAVPRPATASLSSCKSSRRNARSSSGLGRDSLCGPAGQACRRGSADDAGRERHFSWLDARRRNRGVNSMFAL